MSNLAMYVTIVAVIVCHHDRLMTMSAYACALLPCVQKWTGLWAIALHRNIFTIMNRSFVLIENANSFSTYQIKSAS